VDAFATPFVQGQLRKEPVRVTVSTECAHCAHPMEIEIDHNLNYHVISEGCDPIIFMPDVDVFNLAEDSIIDAF